MFENIAKKIKGLAWLILALSCIEAVVVLIIFMALFVRNLAVGILIGILLGAVLIFFNLIGAWFIYGFGELIENSEKTNRLLKKLQTGIFEMMPKENDAAQKQMEQQREEDEKQARFTAYWQEHAEERKALFAKKAEARAALDQKGISKEKKRELSDLISSVDQELTRER